MEVTFEQIMQWVGPGPLAAVVAIGLYALKEYKKRTEITVVENALRRRQIQLQEATIDFLKREGYDVNIPVAKI